MEFDFFLRGCSVCWSICIVFGGGVVMEEYYNSVILMRDYVFQRSLSWELERLLQGYQADERPALNLSLTHLDCTKNKNKRLGVNQTFHQLR